MRGLRLYLIIGGALLVLYLAAQFNQPEEINWSPSLRSTDKIPFGTYILRSQVKDIFPKADIKTGHQPVYNVITDDATSNSSYVIICRQLDITRYDYQKITDYLVKGNDVFISAEQFGSVFDDSLGVTTMEDFSIVNKTIPIHFVSPYLDSAKRYKVDKGCTSISFRGFDTARATVLGEDSLHHANFIRYKFGQGNLYLASNPKMFTNYSMLTTDGASYAATTLSYVKNTAVLVWDEYYTQAHEEQSLMKIFFNNGYLKWAYYITLFSLLLFVLYEMKRRQRVIPIIPPLSNSTVEFVNVIGQLYYEQRNNTDIAHKHALYVLAHLREQYQAKTDKLDEEFIARLIRKVGLEDEFAKRFTGYLQFIITKNIVTDNELIELNKLIEQFYKKSR
jgi:hypothetical protein